MSNKKGFTLAELLGVLAILAIISLITVPLVNKYIANSRQKAYNAELTTLERAAQQWFTKNSASVVWDEYGNYALNLDDLKQSEFLSDEAIYNPLKPDEEIIGCIMINNDNGNYSYSYSATCNIVSDLAFDYTGSVQTVILPAGIYRLEVWGAQGGNSSSYTGGLGGYSAGTYTASGRVTLYIYVGGSGQSDSRTNSGSYTWKNGGYNGGGNSMSDGGSGGGGGATDIRTGTDLSTRIIVAGGGGGAGWESNGFSGGGFQGTSSSGTYLAPGFAGGGGSQTIGGQPAASFTAYNSIIPTAGSLGQGGIGVGSSSGGGAGGGGYYGGGGSGYSIGAGGGSGYIGGVNSSNGVTKAMYCYNCSTSSTSSTLTYSITDSAATPTSNYTKLGNGYAKITSIG